MAASNKVLIGLIGIKVGLKAGFISALTVLLTTSSKLLNFWSRYSILTLTKGFKPSEKYPIIASSFEALSELNFINIDYKYFQ